MATKIVTVPTVGTLYLTKRKNNRNIRLSVTPDGKVRVSLPTWATYQSGINFASAKTAWINRQLSTTRAPSFTDNQAIGKAHHLSLLAMNGTTIQTRLKLTQAIVYYPYTLSPQDPAVQTAARSVAIRALRQEAQKLLPSRLETLAQQGGFQYNSVSIKQLKRRWGSCNQRQEITLNLFLMQLPWSLIDYVLWHELSHTKHLDHSQQFWEELSRHAPAAKDFRRQLRQFTSDF